MRDLARRLDALEARPANRGFRRVVIVAPGDTAPADSDDVHIIRIVGVDRNGNGQWMLPHNHRDPLPELTA